MVSIFPRAVMVLTRQGVDKLNHSPGRFFVAHELKLILAYLVQNYEFKPLVERPKFVWFGSNMIPPVKTTIEVRRRKGTV
jgi:hypothetical protein